MRAQAGGHPQKCLARWGHRHLPIPKGDRHEKHDPQHKENCARGRAAYWDRAIADTYFPLRLTFRDPATFDGRLTRRDIGAISLSRLNTKALLYERLRQHLRTAVEEEYLIAIPRLSPVEFYQVGREVRCDPGGFILERGDEPYRFSYGATNELYVLKLPKRVLSEKLRNPDRVLCSGHRCQHGDRASVFRNGSSIAGAAIGCGACGGSPWATIGRTTGAGP